MSAHWTVISWPVPLTSFMGRILGSSSGGTNYWARLIFQSWNLRLTRRRSGLRQGPKIMKELPAPPRLLTSWNRWRRMERGANGWEQRSLGWRNAANASLGDFGAASAKSMA